MIGRLAASMPPTLAPGPLSPSALPCALRRATDDYVCRMRPTNQRAGCWSAAHQRAALGATSLPRPTTGSGRELPFARRSQVDPKPSVTTATDRLRLTGSLRFRAFPKSIFDSTRELGGQRASKPGVSEHQKGRLDPYRSLIAHFQVAIWQALSSDGKAVFTDPPVIRSKLSNSGSFCNKALPTSSKASICFFSSAQRVGIS
jgi:hypothetical protein